MRKRVELSPVLVELVVVTLFLALSCAAIVQLIAKARDLSETATYQTEALLVTEDLLERVKADPVGDGDFDDAGVRRIKENRGELTVDGVVERASTAGGALYRITARARKGDRELLRLEATTYAPGGEVGG